MLVDLSRLLLKGLQWLIFGLFILIVLIVGLVARLISRRWYKVLRYTLVPISHKLNPRPKYLKPGWRETFHQTANTWRDERKFPYR